MPQAYDVGGVDLERPFKIRRLNHVVLYYRDFRSMLRFYHGLLGFRVMDCIDSKNGPPRLCPYLPTPFFFMTLGPDMHNMAFVPEPVKQTFEGRHEATSIHHYAWDVGSYDELRGSLGYFRSEGIEVREVALRSPGSNYVVYYWDPDSNMQHTQWGGEMIGWQGRSKPVALWRVVSWVRGPRGELDEAIPMDEELTSQALVALEGAKEDISAHSLDPYRDVIEEVKEEFGRGRFNVHGTTMPRPFKLSKLTYVGIRSRYPDRLSDFYTKVNGFKVSARAKDAIYLRHGSDHHGLVIHTPDSPELNGRDRLVRIAMQLRTYAELKGALTFLKENGVEVLAKGRAFPGGEYYIDTLDPEGHQVRLFFYIEQVGWDGKTRPPEKWKPLEFLPDKAEPEEDTYSLELHSALNL